MPIAVAGSGAITGTTTINGLAVPTDAFSPGIVLVNAQTFSGAASVSVNNCFTSNYMNYRVMLFLSASATGNAQLFRFRANGVDDSTNVYWWNSIEKTYAGGVGSTGGGTTTVGQLRITYYTNTNKASAFFDVVNPQVADVTHLAGMTLFGDGGGTVNAQTTASTSYDGFTIYPSSGTITGSLRIYGYRNA